MTEKLQQKLKQLPTKPGVYLHKDAAGKILYVGKAKNLRSRVKSYFRAKPDHDPKTRIMVSKAADLDWIVTRSEVEALLVEANFIKQYRPPYNVVLRDDKNYSFIKITDERWPRVTTARNNRDPKARHFGPYTNSAAVTHTLKTLRRIFPYCLANDQCDDSGRSRPCLYYHLGLCPSPQHGKISDEDYQANIDGLIRVLGGQAEPVRRQLESEMRQASKSRQYERAAGLRDRLDSLQRLLERQQAVTPKPVNRDAVGLALDQGHAVVTLMNVRDGRLVARKQFSFWGAGRSSDREVLDSFLSQYYRVATNVPDEIVIPFEVETADVVARYLGTLREKRVRATVAKRGDRRKLLELAHTNAAEYLRQVRSAWVEDQERTEGALDELAKRLDLNQPPARIECYDISTLSGTSTVGSMVVFQDGRPAPAHYRRFRIRHVKGVDDYASLQEVLRRRFRRLRAEGGESESADASFATVPELIVIDGGKGQVSAAAKVLAEVGLGNLALVGLAKRFEDVYLHDPDSGKMVEVSLRKDSKALYLLERTRDEAHRFAITYGRRVRQKSGAMSTLDDLPGIGPVKKRQLLRKFGSVTRIKQAKLPELEALVGKSAGRVVKENL
jgi:excinuclease ABC subunit C